MAYGPLGGVLDQLRRPIGRPADQDEADTALLERFLASLISKVTPGFRGSHARERRSGGGRCRCGER